MTIIQIIKDGVTMSVNFQNAYLREEIEMFLKIQKVRYCEEDIEEALKQIINKKQ